MKRILFAALAALTVIPGACSDGSGPTGSSRTQVVLTDAPFPYDNVAHVNLYINRVDATDQADTIPGVQQWTNIASPEQAFDLLTLQQGSTAILGDVDLPAGHFRALRMVIDPSKSSVVMKDGSNALVHWPYAGPDGLSTMYAIVEEPLAPGPGARIVIDFDVGRSFLMLESSPPQFVLVPWLRAVNEAATGHLAGTVTTGGTIEGGGTPAAGAAVTVLKGNPQLSPYTWYVAATGRADAQGRYAINFLRDGDYIVRFEENVGMLTMMPGCIDFTHVSINRQETTTLNAAMSHGVDLCAAHSPNDTSGQGPDTSITAPGGPVATVDVHVWLPAAGLHVGDSIPASAELRNAAGGVLSGRVVTWSLSDTSLATLEGVFGTYAHLRAKAAGSVTLTATSEGKVGSIVLTILAGTGGGGGGGGGATGPVASVTLSPASANPAVGDSIGFYATPKNASGAALSGRVISYAISDSTVARIMGAFGQSVVIRALKAGSATLTATSEGVPGTAAITVH